MKRRLICTIILIVTVAGISTAASSHGAAPSSIVQGARLENIEASPATVTLRSARGVVVKEVRLSGRSATYVRLGGVEGPLGVTVTRQKADAGQLLADILARGASRGGSSHSEGSTHRHNGEPCNDPNCSSGSSGSGSRGNDIGGVLFEVLTSGSGREGGSVHVIDGVKIVVDEEQPHSSVTIADTPPDPGHHCQGGRLVIVVGHFADAAINATLRFAEGLQAEGHHLHMIGYPTGGSSREPSWSIPHVPPPAGYRPTSVNEIWPRYQSGGRNRNLDDLLATWRDCCFFEEVLVVFHGGQTGSFRGLVANLPKMLNHRPVRKLVIWSCESTDAFYPGTGGAGGERNYRRIAYIVRPKDCPCGCRHDDCIARGPRGERMRCPTASEPVTIFASATVEGRAAKLGLDAGDPRAPFTTPNGQLRRITVSEDGSIRAEIVEAGATVFGGLRSKAEPALARESNTRIDVNRVLQDARVQDPANYNATTKPYTGPRACPNGEGCIPDAM